MGTLYLLDLNAGLTQVLADGDQLYLYGLTRLAQERPGDASAYYLPDALGSVRQLVTWKGELVLSQRYAPYGPLLDSAGAGSSIFQFTGEQFDDAAGLTYLRARYYAGGVGRFTTKDVWEGDEGTPMSYNKWMYGYADPINLVDPTGHRPDCGYLSSQKAEAIDCQKSFSESGPPNPSEGYSEKKRPEGITFVGRDLPTLDISSYDYQSNSYVPVLPRNKNYAQKIALPRPDLPEKVDSIFDYTANTGLCGDGSLAVILGETLENVANAYVANVLGKKFQAPENINGTLEYYDYNPNYLDLDEIAKLAEIEYGVSSFLYTEAHNWRRFGSVLNSWLNNNQHPIVGVGISADTGKIGDGDVRHWVTITGISSQWDKPWGKNLEDNFSKSPWKWVRVYNPFDNETEYYWWPDFKETLSAKMLVVEK